MPTPDQGKLYPLPAQDDAPHLCVTLSIPGDQETISNFIGALMRLASWNNYRRDDRKRAKNIAQVWKGIIETIEFYNCNEPPGGGGGCGDGCEDMCCLRVFEGKLQSMQCGVWTTIDGGDLAALAGPGVQQPPPGGTIEPGDCQEYDVTLYGSNAYLLPITVSDGNTIQITAATGGWSDGESVGPFGAAWSCPSGQVYALGACGAPNGPGVDDPLPSADHMRLIAKVGADYFDAYNTTITVPAGASDVPVVFQANDAAIANNQGSITFHVSVCNTAPLTWCYEWNLLTERGPFAPLNDSGQSFSLWFAGVGWQNPAWSGGAQLTLLPTFDTSGCTHIEYDVDCGTPIVAPQHIDILDDDGMNTLSTTPVVAGTVNAAWSGDPANGQVWLNCFNFEADPALFTMTRVKMSGRGAGPLGPSTC